MHSLSILTHLTQACSDEAATPREAIARARVRILKGLVREHRDRAESNERWATQFEEELNAIVAEHGWTDSVDTDDEENA